MPLHVKVEETENGNGKIPICLEDVTNKLIVFLKNGSGTAQVLFMFDSHTQKAKLMPFIHIRCE